MAVQVFYDGWCPFCISQVTALKRLDWLDLVIPVSVRDPGVADDYGLDLEKAVQRLHSRACDNGSLREGIDAVIQVTCRVIPYWPLVPSLVLLRLLGVGQWAYDQVAKRRMVTVPTCQDGACRRDRPS